jgi:hypothetical protein
MKEHYIEYHCVNIVSGDKPTTLVYSLNCESRVQPLISFRGLWRLSFPILNGYLEMG